MPVTITELNGSQYTKYLLSRVRILEIQFLYQGLVNTHSQITEKQKKIIIEKYFFKYFSFFLKRKRKPLPTGKFYLEFLYHFPNPDLC